MSTQKTLGHLLVRLGMTDREAEKAIRDFKRKLKKLGSDVKEIGKKMSVAFTAPFALAMKKSIENYNIQEQAVRRLQVATGGQTQALLEQASAIQKVTTYGDEQIITQQAFLASLGLTEETIKDVTQGAVNLSAALGISLESATKNLAKTTAGMTGELGELIPGLKQFTAEQLKSGAAIKYANEQFAGFAEAAALVGTGPLKQLQNSVGDVAEQFGEVFMPIVISFTAHLKELVKWFSNLDVETKKAYVGIGLLVAGIGPLLVALPSIITGFAALMTPLGAAAAIFVAVGVGIAYAVQNWDALERRLKSTQVGALFAKNIDDILKGDIFATQKNLFKYAFGIDRPEKETGPGGRAQSWWEAGKKLETPKEFLKNFGGNIADFLGWDSGKKMLDEAQKTIDELTKSLKGLKDEMDDPGTGGAKRIAQVIEPIATLATNTSISFGGESEDPVLKGMKAIEGDPTAKWKAHTEALDKYKNTWLTLGDAIGGAVESMGQALAEGANFFAAFGKAALKAAAQVAKAALVEVVANAMAAESKKGLPGILIGAAAGIAGISILENLISNVKTPKLAEGAMIFGPTRAIVGDNPNVMNDPEVVSPLSKLKGMLSDMAPQNINVSGILNGDHIYLASVKAHERSVRRGSPNGFLSDIITY